MLKDLNWVQWFQCSWYWNLGWPLDSLQASSSGHSGAGLGKEGEFTSVPLEFEFCLQFPCGSSSTELSDFCQSAGSRNERECKQTLMRHALRVMTSLLHCNVISTNPLQNAPVDPCRPQNRGSHHYLRAHKGSWRLSRPLIQDSSVRVLFPWYKGNLT